MRPLMRQEKDTCVAAMITWYAELIYVTAEVGTLLPQIQIHHKYKGGGKNPEKIGTYRPLGLADPLLSLLSDVRVDLLTEEIR